MSKIRTRNTAVNVMQEINRILNITDSYQAPDRIMRLISSEEPPEETYRSMAELFGYEYEREWFYEYFEDEHADRRNNKQDFTPPSVSRLISEVLQGERRGVIYEPAAGTGSTVIAHWYAEHQRAGAPWNYNPLDYLYICEEKSDKTIPFLLFNLLIRGMNAVVIHGDSLTREVKEIYHCFNEDNNAMGRSTLKRLKHCKEAAEWFGVRWGRSD